MGNCLVTKLKESINNDNLPFLDYIVVKVKSGNALNTQVITGFGQIAGYTPKPSVAALPLEVELLTTDDTEFKRGGVGVGKKTTYTAGGIPIVIGTTLTNEMPIKILKKNLTAIGYTNGDNCVITDYGFEKWGYMENLAWLAFPENSYRGKKFNIKVFKNNLPNLQYIDTSFGQYTCKDLADSVPSIRQIYARGLYGNFEDLASMPNLIKIDTMLASIATTGDYKIFVDRKRNLYSTNSGTLKVNNPDGVAIKFNDKSISSGHNYTLVWDASSIILKDPETLAGRIAYSYGASAAQISELETNGYNVTQVD